MHLMKIRTGSCRNWNWALCPFPWHILISSEGSQYMGTPKTVKPCLCVHNSVTEKQESKERTRRKSYVHILWSERTSHKYIHGIVLYVRWSVFTLEPSLSTMYSVAYFDLLDCILVEFKMIILGITVLLWNNPVIAFSLLHTLHLELPWPFVFTFMPVSLLPDYSWPSVFFSLTIY